MGIVARSEGEKGQLTVQSPALTFFRERLLLRGVLLLRVGLNVMQKVHQMELRLVSTGAFRSYRRLRTGLVTCSGASAYIIRGLLYAPHGNERVRFCMMAEVVVIK